MRKQVVAAAQAELVPGEPPRRQLGRKDAERASKSGRQQAARDPRGEWASPVKGCVCVPGMPRGDGRVLVNFLGLEWREGGGKS